LSPCVGGTTTTRFEQFIKERTYLKNVSRRTIEWHEQSLKWLKTEEPTEDELKACVMRMREAGLNASSVNCCLRSINAYLKWSGSKLKVPKLKEQQNVLPTFTTEDIKKLVMCKPKGFYERRLHALMLTLFVGPGVGQNDPAKEKAKATDQMRQVAQAIKQCPPAVARMSPPNSQCFSTEAKAGPPLNVTWDVVEKRTARAPYQGYVEFELPATGLIDQLQPTDRKVAKACDRNYQIEAQGATFVAQAGLAAELGLPDDVEPPRSKVWHFRFEFDVGSDDPELVKMLWTDETGKAQAVTAGHSCWGKAAQAVGTSSAP
jgi:hypothetical protein